MIFEFPSAYRGSMGVRKLAEPGFRCVLGAELPPSADSPVVSDLNQFPPVSRRFKPEPAALEQLVDVLCHLLFSGTDSQSDPAPPPCVSLANE
jgi:hypothetical protein